MINSRPRNFFTLVLIALLAAGTIAATTAYAEQQGHFTASEPGTSTHVSAFVTADDSTEDLAFNKGAAESTYCAEDVFHGLIGGTAKTLTLQPTFGGTGQGWGDGSCVAAGLPATIEENGCHLELYTLETDPGAADWQALSRIAGCNGPGIEIQVFAGESHMFEVCMSTAIENSPRAAIQPPHSRPRLLPTGGHRFSPLEPVRRSGVAKAVGRSAAAASASSHGQLNGTTPLPSVAWVSR